MAARGTFLIGSDEHKELFCRSFVESHERYDPLLLPWPVLDDGALARLRALPFWDMALQAETNAGAMVTGFASTIDDPVVRDAVALQGLEEERHGKLIATLVDRYGLGATRRPPELEPTEAQFVHFGYRECLDSFFGFGIFRIAHETEFMPESLISLFTRVLWEEARHIVFFVNWIAYERVRRGYRNALVQAIATAIGYVRALVDMVASGKKMTETPAQAGDGGTGVLPGLSLVRLLEACLQENDRLMARFDERLLRPRVMPLLARGVLGAVNAGEQVRNVVAPRPT